MVEIKGDFWEYFSENNLGIDGLVCTTNNTLTKNNKLVMGAGIAKLIRDKFIGIDDIWGKTLKQIYDKHDYPNAYSKYYNPVLITGYSRLQLDSSPLYLFAFPTKYHWKDRSDIDLIRDSGEYLVHYVNIMGLDRILMTRPGCGNGGLKWEDVKKVLYFLDDRFEVVNND